MTGLLTLAEVADATGADVLPSLDPSTAAVRVREVATDTRTLQPGDLFIALRGPRTDGHRFVVEAAGRGAVGVVVATPPEGALPVPVFLVSDTLRALGAIAARHRRHLRADVVGITGSVGKTTVAGLTALVLERRFQVVRSAEAWNAEIGVPLTLLRAGPQTQVIVMEMAMRGLGQIRELVEIARPRIGVVTNVGESHLGLLGSVEQIAQAKGELVEGLPADGVAVLNADDPWSDRLAARAACRVIRFGFSPAADVRADAVAAAGPAMTFRMIHGAESAEVHLLLAGRHNVANALAAAAVGIALGVPLEAARAALADAVPVAGRLQIEEAGDVLVINDTYNASPRSVRAALDVLEAVAGDRRRVAVLGDMKELGDASAELHREIGRDAAARGLAVLIAVGPEAAALAEGARAIMGAGRVIHVPDRDAALPALRARVGSADVVLVKGSRAMGLETLVEALRLRVVQR